MTLGSFEDFLEESRTIIDFTENNTCSRCGSCCTKYLPLSKFDKIRIRAFIRDNDIKDQTLFIPTTDVMFNMVCPFFSSEKKVCLIYSVRPLICQRFICNQDPKLIKIQRDALINRFGTTNVREYFYGKE